MLYRNKICETYNNKTTVDKTMHTIRYHKRWGKEYIFCPEIQDEVEHKVCRKCNQFGGYSKKYRDRIECNLDKPLITKPTLRVQIKIIESCRSCPHLGLVQFEGYRCTVLPGEDMRGKIIPEEIVTRNGIYKDCPINIL